MRSRFAHDAAFTLIELLVCISVIALLVAILLPALGKARQTGKMAKELSAARMLLVGHTRWTLEHKGKLFRTTDYSPDYKVYNDRGDLIWDPATGVVDGSHNGYSWRLAPYFDYHIEGALLVNEQALMLKSYNPSSPLMYNYLTNLVPSLGMNRYLGLAYHATTNPTSNPLLDEADVRCPSELLVVASAWNTGFAEYPEGNREVFQPTGAFNASNPASLGNVDPRWDGRAVVGFMDGHASLLDETQVRGSTALWRGR